MIGGGGSTTHQTKNHNNNLQRGMTDDRGFMVAQKRAIVVEDLSDDPASSGVSPKTSK